MKPNFEYPKKTDQYPKMHPHNFFLCKNIKISRVRFQSGKQYILVQRNHKINGLLPKSFYPKIPPEHFKPKKMSVELKEAW